MKLLLGLLLITPALAQDLRTFAEKSGWKSTGRAVEVKLLCNAFQKRWPKLVRCRSYGKTPEGRELTYITVGERNPKNPVLWVQAGIHAGEIDGKDAVFWLMRDLLEGKHSPDPLSGITMVFVPIVNLDGHERFGKWNRPNQVGPEEMGWRVTGQNLNLNRDFAKAEAPEMRSLLKLWTRIDPVVSLDLHVTNGAQFQPEIGIIVSPNVTHGEGPLHRAGRVLENEVLSTLKERGHMALPFYPSFEEEDRPESGFSRHISSPRFSEGYWYSQNRIGVLVESHSWKDYATRVATHYSTVLGALKAIQKHGKDWKEEAKKLDQESLAGKEVPLSFKHNGKSKTIEFPGYHFEIRSSKVSGGKIIKYFPDRPEVWKIPLYEELIPNVTVKAPRKGYIVPAPHSPWLIEKLKVHGLKWRKWTGPLPEEAEVFRARKTVFSPTPFEGRQTLRVSGAWVREKVELPKGSIFVPLDQKKGLLVLQLLEPTASDSFLSWGFFNAAFEQKEYMENYVAEEVALEMLKDPSVRAEFEERLKDKSFAKDEAARFDFFYRRHPSWDKNFNRYPVVRL